MAESKQTDPITKHIVENPTKVLVVSAKAIPWLITMDNDAYQIDWIGDAGQAMEILQKEKYELILLNDTLFQGEAARFVREIKRRLPLVPVFILSDNKDIAYQTDLIEAGIDDFLSNEAPAEALRRRFSLMLGQRRQNLALARRNQNLQAVTLLSRRLHSSDHPTTLVIDTIDLASTTFKLYGVVIALDEGEKLHIYAGSAGINKNRRLYESTVPVHNYDPFKQSIVNNIVQIFKDINLHPFFTPIPVLPEAASAIIVPLNYGEQIIGAICVLGTKEHELERDDLVIYELFANHFASAFHNVRHYYTQDVSVQSNRHLLRAWQRLTSLYKIQDIAETLRELVRDIPNIRQSLIWISDGTDQVDQLVINAEEEAKQAFRDLHERGHINRLVDQFDNRMQPLNFILGRDKQDPLGPLFRAMDGQQLLIAPISDSLRLLGLIVVSTATNQPLQVEDINVIEGLSHATGQTLERNILISAMEEQAGRLEAILRSIKEGIFFVAETDEVVFCNPQFTELTGINPSEVLQKSPQNLLDQLAQKSTNPDKVRDTLREAVTKIEEDKDNNTDYPIIELSIEDLDTNVYIEFVSIPHTKEKASSWLGFLRTDKQITGTGTKDSDRKQILNHLLESIGLPYAQLYSSIMTLSEQHGNFSRRERSQFLANIERQADRVGQLWNNFMQVYNLEVSGLALEREDIDPIELVENILDSRSFVKYRRRIQVDAQPMRVTISVDERYIERAIANILENSIKFSPKDSSIHIQLRAQGSEVFISIQDQGPGIPTDQISNIFDPFYQGVADGETGAGLGLYLSNEIVKKHGGRIVPESRRGRGTIMTIALPIASVDGEIPTEDEKISSRASSQTTPNTIMVVESQSHLTEANYSALETVNYELIITDSGDDALRDIEFVRLDLIILEIDRNSTNRLNLCQSLREKTETPIMIFSDHDSEEERIKALEMGADDYVTGPISYKELVARINAIAKRKLIPARTKEPLRVGAVYIDFARREVYLDNQLLDLTRIEYDLLQTLALNKGQVLTHKQLLEKVWGPEYRDETQYLWVNVSRLRKKLEPTPDSPRYIHTQPGTGYIFREP